MTVLREHPTDEITRMPVRSRTFEWTVGILGVLAAAVGAWMYFVPSDWFLGGLAEGWYLGARQPGQHCDEYPMINMEQGGEFSTPTPSLKAIDASHNSNAGASFSVFYKDCTPAGQGKDFLVIPVRHGSQLGAVPFEKVLPTFWAGCDT